VLNRIATWLRGLFSRKPISLVIVRRYADANGNYVGELYMQGTFSGVASYRMIGVSLDSLPLNVADLMGNECFAVGGMLDTANDFLVHMPNKTIRVGALDPKDNDNVRRMVAKLPRRNMTMTIQNRFIEHVLEGKTK
jgi:hypothetical protein